MKKIIAYFITIVISASIPIYFLFIWEPLKSKDVLNQNISQYNNEEAVVNENKDTIKLNINNGKFSNNLFGQIGEIEKEKKEKLDVLIKNLSIVDIIKVNNYFSDREDLSNIGEGMSLIKKRMSNEDYEEFKGIINDYIDLNTIDKEI